MAKGFELTMGKGKKKRTWSLTKAQFERFEREFEEAELVEVPKGAWNVTLVDTNETVEVNLK